MSDKNEPIFDNEDFLILLLRYEKMKDSKGAVFFDVEEFEQIIDYYLDELEYENATEAAELGAKLHPASVEIKYKIIHIYLEQGQGKQALEVINQIPVWEHSNSEFFYLQGTALCLTGKIHEAEKSFDTGLTLSSDDIFEALLNISIAFENARHFHLAIKYLEKAHSLSPDYLSVLYDLGYFNERLDNYKKSIEYYHMYLDIDPFSENVWYNLGVAYYKLENFVKAIDAYDYSIALNPDYASAYFNKANTYGTMGDYARAIETISEFIQIEPENSQAYVFLGDAYEQMQNFEKALSTYKKVIELDNTDNEGWFGAGMVLYQMNQYDEAITYLLKALEFDKQNTDYWMNLGYVYEEKGLIEDALRCYQQVILIDHDDIEAWLLQANLLIVSGEVEIALVSLQRAYAHFPEDPSISMKIAICYYLLNEPRKGVKFLETALKEEPQLLPELRIAYEETFWDDDTKDVISKYCN